MVILQCPDAVTERARITGLGVRSVFEINNPDYIATHFHPRDLRNILLSIDSVGPEADYLDRMCSWPPGGPYFFTVNVLYFSLFPSFTSRMRFL